MAITIDTCFVHPSVEAAPQALPALVFLHGKGERGSDRALLEKHGPPRYSTQPGLPAYHALSAFRVIAPQCPLDHTWYDEAVTAAVVSLLNQLSDVAFVDRTRIYLTGWSLGGFGVCSVLCSTDIVAAAVIVSGGCQGGNVARLSAATPLWVAYGLNDSVVRANVSQTLVKELRARGGMPRVSEFRDANGGRPSAHVLACQNTFSDPALYDWLLLHRKPAT